MFQSHRASISFDGPDQGREALLAALEDLGLEGDCSKTAEAIRACIMLSPVEGEVTLETVWVLWDHSAGKKSSLDVHLIVTRAAA
jgi:hypothetical protein